MAEPVLTKQQFAELLKEFCLRHGFEISGTCDQEGIYGEITIQTIAEGKAWQDWDNHKFNFYI